MCLLNVGDPLGNSGSESLIKDSYCCARAYYSNSLWPLKVRSDVCHAFGKAAVLRLASGGNPMSKKLNWSGHLG